MDKPRRMSQCQDGMHMNQEGRTFVCASLQFCASLEHDAEQLRLPTSDISLGPARSSLLVEELFERGTPPFVAAATTETLKDMRPSPPHCKPAAAPGQMCG
jgi:hypothetical protein